jgi:hypothetical protein
MMTEIDAIPPEQRESYIRKVLASWQSIAQKHPAESGRKQAQTNIQMLQAELKARGYST